VGSGFRVTGSGKDQIQNLKPALKPAFESLPPGPQPREPGAQASMPVSTGKMPVLPAQGGRRAVGRESEAPPAFGRYSGSQAPAWKRSLASSPATASITGRTGFQPVPAQMRTPVPPGFSWFWRAAGSGAPLVAFGLKILGNLPCFLLFFSENSALPKEHNQPAPELPGQPANRKVQLFPSKPPSTP
jgi:hypothetical protein